MLTFSQFMQWNKLQEQDPDFANAVLREINVRLYPLTAEQIDQRELKVTELNGETYRAAADRIQAIQ